MQVTVNFTKSMPTATSDKILIDDLNIASVSSNTPSFNVAELPPFKTSLKLINQPLLTHSCTKPQNDLNLHRSIV